ncbi:MAG: hypothetical protein ACLQUY_19260 [Ktedonobacterales bacterium]
MLHHERLVVARTDLKLDHATNTLVRKGFWLDQRAAQERANALGSKQQAGARIWLAYGLALTSSACSADGASCGDARCLPAVLIIHF